MAAIHDLLQQVSDPALRERLEAEIDRITKQKKFGLVFEDHLPECTPLYDMPVTRGAKVALRGGNVSDIFTVLKIENGIASCVRKEETELHEFPVGELLCVAESVISCARRTSSESGLLFFEKATRSNCWNICTRARWTAFTLTRPITQARGTGSTTTIMWTVRIPTGTANGSPSCRSV